MWEFELIVYFQPLLQLLRRRAVDRTAGLGRASQTRRQTFQRDLLLCVLRARVRWVSHRGRGIETGALCSLQFTLRRRTLLPPAGVCSVLQLQQAREETVFISVPMWPHDSWAGFAERFCLVFGTSEPLGPLKPNCCNDYCYQCCWHYSIKAIQLLITYYLVKKSI